MITVNQLPRSWQNNFGYRSHGSHQPRNAWMDIHTRSMYTIAGTAAGTLPRKRPACTHRNFQNHGSTGPPRCSSGRRRFPPPSAGHSGHHGFDMSRFGLTNLPSSLDRFFISSESLLILRWAHTATFGGLSGNMLVALITLPYMKAGGVAFSLGSVIWKLAAVVA